MNYNSDHVIGDIISYHVPVAKEGVVYLKHRESAIEDELVDESNGAITWYKTMAGDLVKGSKAKYVYDHSVTDWAQHARFEGFPDSITGHDVTMVYTAYTFWCSEQKPKATPVGIHKFAAKVCELSNHHLEHSNLIDDDYFVQDSEVDNDD